MLKNCEVPILEGEPFIIKHFEKPEKPILAHADKVTTYEDWQLVSLLTLAQPRSNYDMSTRRRLGYGIYTSSNGSLLYLRAELIGSEIPGYFSEDRLEIEKFLTGFIGRERYVQSGIR